MYRFFLGFRYLLSRPINLLGVMAVMLGVWAPIVVVSIFSGFLETVKGHVRTATGDVVVWRLGPNVDYKPIRTIVQSDPEVVACTPRLGHASMLHPVGNRGQRTGTSGLHAPRGENHLVTLIGIDPETESQVSGFQSWLLTEDRQALLRDLTTKRDWILLGERRAGLEGADAGKVLTLTTAQQTREGLRTDKQRLRLAGTYRLSYKNFEEYTAFVHIERLRKILGYTTEHVSEVSVRLTDTELRHVVSTRLGHALASRAGAGPTPPRADAWERRQIRYLNGVSHQRGIMKFVLFVILVLSMFQIYATLSMTVTEKTRDIGVLSAMGGTPFGVMQVFMACGLGICLVGALLGVLVGCLSAMGLDSFRNLVLDVFGYDLFPIHIYNLDRVPYHLETEWILTVGGGALVVGLLVATLPAFRAARLNPMDALRTE